MSGIAHGGCGIATEMTCVSTSAVAGPPTRRIPRVGVVSQSLVGSVGRASEVAIEMMTVEGEIAPVLVVRSESLVVPSIPRPSEV